MKKIRIDLIIYILISSILYLLLIKTEDEINNGVKLLSIFFYMVSSFYFVRKRNENKFFVYALMFTFLADVFLSNFHELTYGKQLVAMVSFSIVQIMYLLILNEANKKISLIFIIIRILIVILGIVLSLVILKDNVNAVVILTMFYISNLLLSFIQSLFTIKKLSLLLPLGFLSYLMCDVFLGLEIARNEGYLAFNESLNLLLDDMIQTNWLFYSLAQFFIILTIAVSKRNIDEVSHENK